jgi:hypothetical protein
VVASWVCALYGRSCDAAGHSQGARRRKRKMKKQVKLTQIDLHHKYESLTSVEFENNLSRKPLRHSNTPVATTREPPEWHLNSQETKNLVNPLGKPWLRVAGGKLGNLHCSICAVRQQRPTARIGLAAYAPPPSIGLEYLQWPHIVVLPKRVIS